eukprot:1318112-Pleurochrysis_carterae.AAC.4
MEEAADSVEGVPNGPASCGDDASGARCSCNGFRPSPPRGTMRARTARSSAAVPAYCANSVAAAAPARPLRSAATQSTSPSTLTAEATP